MAENDSTLLLEAIDNVNYARGVSLKSLREFVGELIGDGGVKEDGQALILAVQLFAQDADRRLAVAEQAIEAVRSAKVEVRHD